MEAHHGAEARELRPAGVECAPGGIADAAAVAADEEGARVAVPVGQTRNGEVAGCGNLSGQRLPTGGDVGAPDEGARALHAGEGGGLSARILEDQSDSIAFVNVGRKSEKEDNKTKAAKGAKATKNKPEPPKDAPKDKAEDMPF